MASRPENFIGSEENVANSSYSAPSPVPQPNPEHFVGSESGTPDTVLSESPVVVQPVAPVNNEKFVGSEAIFSNTEVPPSSTGTALNSDNFIGSEGDIVQPSVVETQTQPTTALDVAPSPAVSPEPTAPSPAPVPLADPAPETISAEERLRGMQSMLATEIEERNRINSELTYKSGRTEDERWKQSYEVNPETGVGRGLRNERGHYTTMELEHERALADNERLDSINRRIESIRRLLAELEEEVNGPSPADPAPAPSEAVEPTAEEQPEAVNVEVAPAEPVAEEEPVGIILAEAVDQALDTEVATTVPSPEITGRRREALILINEIAKRDQARAVERYGGFRPFGALAGLLRFVKWKGAAERVENLDNRISSRFNRSAIGRSINNIRLWCNKVGDRRILDDEQLADEESIEQNLQEVGNFTRHSGWRKVLKIGAKVMGGLGVASAMVFTGGLGAATSLLWAGGLKEGYDGVLQSFEELGWGNRRASAEVTTQEALSSQIEALKTKLNDQENPITDEEYAQFLLNITQAENGLMDQEAKNITGERKWQMFRSITSSVLTAGTGYFVGVPMGTINYDQDNTAIAEALRQNSDIGNNAQVMNEAHRGFWTGTQGGQFAYGPTAEATQGVANMPELQWMQSAVKYVNGLEPTPLGGFTLTPSSVYGMASHGLGAGGLKLIDNIQIGAAAGYLLGESLRHAVKRPSLEGDPYRAIGRPTPPAAPGAPTEAAAGTPAAGTDAAANASATETPLVAAAAGEAAAANPAAPETPAPAETPAAPEPDTTPPASPEAPPLETAATDAQIFGGLSGQERNQAISIANNIARMDRSCEATILAPITVAGRDSLSGLLENLANQEDDDEEPLEPGSYEVLLYSSQPSDKPAAISAVNQQISEFSQANPEFNIRFVPDLPANLDENERQELMTNVTRYRSLRRGNTDVSPIRVETLDVDAAEVDANFVSSI